MSADYLELVFAEELNVSVPCHKYRPVASGIVISRLDKTESTRLRPKRPDPFPLLSELTVYGAQAFIRKQPCTSAKQVGHTDHLVSAAH